MLIATRPEYLEQKSNFVPVSYIERKACCIFYCNYIKLSSRYRLKDMGSRPDRVKYLHTIYCVQFVSIKLFAHNTCTFDIQSNSLFPPGFPTSAVQ